MISLAIPIFGKHYKNDCQLYLELTMTIEQTDLDSAQIGVYRHVANINCVYGGNFMAHDGIESSQQRFQIPCGFFCRFFF